MPQMANITVKKSDGTTDIIYTALGGSSGDNTPAIWEVTASSTYSAFRNKFRATSRDNAGKTARNVELFLEIPETILVNGETKLVGKVPVKITVVKPLNVSDAIIKEAVYQAGNLAISVLMRDTMTSGYSPN